jgi:serine/threonine protein kinase
MAPEQARGDVQHFGPHTDVYGLGAILYYILYGQPPNYLAGGSLNLKSVLDNVSQPKQRLPLRAGILPRGVRIPQEVRESLEDLEEISLKALTVDPADRFACAEDLIIELNEWLRHTPFKRWRETVGTI